jgi:hypothetical protein
VHVKRNSVGFVVLTAVTVNSTVFWVVKDGVIFNKTLLFKDKL